jgi:hypothetical protein
MVSVGEESKASDRTRAGEQRECTNSLPGLRILGNAGARALKSGFHFSYNRTKGGGVCLRYASDR